MARNFTRASSQYLRCSSGSPVSGTYPITLHCLYRPASLPAAAYDEHALVCCAKSSARDDVFLELYQHGDATQRVRATAFANGAADALVRSLTQTLSVGTWYAITGVFTNSTTCEIYVDAAPGDTYMVAGPAAPSGMTDFIVGNVVYDTSFASYYLANGDIAEVAVWDAALSLAEVEALSNRASPQQIRPGNLVAYAPLYGKSSPEPEIVGGLALTLVNTPTEAPHARVFRPSTSARRAYDFSIVTSAAPTFIQEAETLWGNITSPKGSGNFTTQTGDVVVAVSVKENDANDLSQTGTNVTLAVQQTVDQSGYCEMEVSAGVVATGGTTSVSFARTGSTSNYGGNALTFRDSDGIGASAKTNTIGAPSLNITTTQDNSAIVVAVGDYSALDGASRTWRTVNGYTPSAGNGYEVTYFRDSVAYTVYVAYYPDAGVVGAKTVGLSAPSGQQYAIVALEVKGTAGVGGGASILQQMMAYHH